MWNWWSFEGWEIDPTHDDVAVHDGLGTPLDACEIAQGHGRTLPGLLKVEALSMQILEECLDFRFFDVSGKNDLAIAGVTELKHLRTTMTVGCVTKSVDLRTVIPIMDD